MNPSGNSLVLVDWFDSTRGGIVKYDLQTSNRSLLADAQMSVTRYPKYAFDGSKIAFASQPSTAQMNLWSMDSAGFNHNQLTTEGIADDAFSWSPNGDLIVFVQYRFDQWPPQNGTLWIVHVSTTQKRQLTFNPQPRN
jgi:Tol biopolymer transport system component